MARGLEAGQLTRTATIVAVGRAAGTLSVFALWGILARPWSQSQLGLFLALWTGANALIPVFQLGLPTALLYFFPRASADGRRRLTYQVAGLLAGAGLVLAAGGRALTPALVNWLQPAGLDPGSDLNTCLTAIAPFVLATVAAGFVEPALVAAGRPVWQAILAVGAAAAMTAVALLTVERGWGVPAALWALSAVAAARLATGALLVYRAVGGRKAPAGSGMIAAAALVRYSVPIALTDSVGSASRYVDRVVVLFFFAAATFPQYQLGAFEVPIGLLLSAIVTVLVPEVSRLYAAGQLAAIARLWRHAVGRLALLVLPLCAFLLVFAEPVLTLYATDRYIQARWVFRVFLLALPLRCAVFNPLLVGMGKARWALWGSIGDLAANAFLSVALVQWLTGRGSDWAYLGPAIGAVAATYLQVAFLLAAIARHLRWSLGQMLPWGRLLRVGGAAAAAAGAARAAAHGQAAPDAALGVGGLVFVAAMAVALLAWPPERRDLGQIAASLLAGTRRRR